MNIFAKLNLKNQSEIAPVNVPKSFERNFEAKASEKRGIQWNF
jgi:hypothetical protein